MERYFSENVECASREEITKIQSEKLVAQVKHVYDNVPYYRKKMEEKGVTPDDIKGIEDLYKLPFICKDDLKDAYPYGFLGVPKSEVSKIHSTSGTTGKRVIAYYTKEDEDIWYECCARALTAAGATKEDVVQVAYGYGLFTGASGVDGGAHAIGAMTVPMSSGNTDRQITFMRDLGSTILCCTPSYAAYIGETIAEMGIKPEELTLKSGVFGAEPWTEAMRKEIEASLGIKAYDIYGLTELGGPGVSYECHEQKGMHINEDHYIAEIINPETGEVLPDGEKGELVFTSLDKKGFPMLRYRTKDICVLNKTKCSCGRTFVRMAKPMGRSDDMMIIRGVNVFPSQIETVLLQEGYKPNYRIEVDRKNNTDTLDIYVELNSEKFSDTVKGLEIQEKSLAGAIKTMLGINPKVHLVPEKSIARSEGKAVRIVDKRKLID